jgi:hypothetical protein
MGKKELKCGHEAGETAFKMLFHLSQALTMPLPIRHGIIPSILFLL